MLNNETVVRAWKDPEFRASLSPEDRASIPENPSGRSITELDETELGNVSGGEDFCTVTLNVLCRYTYQVWCRRPSINFICPTTTITRTVLEQ